MTTAKKKYTNCDEIYKSLQGYFLAKNYEPGDRVPPERKIAEELNVNRTTLRIALTRMEEEGLLSRQVGVGSFFKVSPKEVAENYARIDTKCNHLELLEIRNILEPQIASIAALNATNAQIKSLKKLCVVKKNIDNLELEQIDIDFHNLIAEISANCMLEQVYSVVCNLRKKLIKQCLENKGIENENIYGGFSCVRTWEDHQHNIIHAFEQHNAKTAKHAVKEKLRSLIGEYSALK